MTKKLVMFKIDFFHLFARNCALSDIHANRLLSTGHLIIEKDNKNRFLGIVFKKEKDWELIPIKRYIDLGS